ncbi:hypothetical protein CBR_g4221 [Chara braunii]|uniref:Reverse transcriptase RNase H-like domain-containing protein n=1 Tax=Chara braunii TaxID=69332 RepID=A0A388JR69_CHABU|nr:hypothetical protein CBR_g4221 [Chara braunii]|eukprot:GBG60268.1 hypothetical protein CBR_g4221 [Chara braunii]
MSVAAAAEKKKAEDAEKARLLAIEQQRQHDGATAKAADEERNQQREKVSSEERALLTMAAAWRTEAEGGEFSDSGTRISLLLSHLTNLLATCIAQQEDIHSLGDMVKNQQRWLDQVNSCLQQLEQRPVAAPVASSSNTSDRLNALEVDVGALKDGMQRQQTATQQFEHRVCTPATHSSMSQRESTPKFDGQEIFCDTTKKYPILWFRQFELKLQLHHFHETRHHSYLYSRSGGACQAWMKNLLSEHGVVATDLHTKISWEDLKAAWRKQFQIEPPEMKAMDKLNKFHQNTLPSGDWIAEFQHLTFVSGVPMGFPAMKHYFISRLSMALPMALTQVADTLTTTAELFDKVVQIIVMITKAKNLSSTAGQSREQHRPNVVVVAAATSTDPSSEAVSANEGGETVNGGPNIRRFRWQLCPLSDKIQAIQEWPESRNVTDVRSFFGPTGYYQRFIKGYSKIAAHLTKLQCEDQPFDFGEDARESFLALKVALLSVEVLCIYDSLLSTRVATDASGYGIGVVLEQHDGVDWHPIKVSVVHSIDDARKELLAFVNALERWRHFLLGRSQSRWVTDNNPLVFYKIQNTVNSTIARWMAFIKQFDFFPDRISGKSNCFADALSRRPDHCTTVYSTFEIDDDLRDSFISGYQADPEFHDKYANCSSPNPAPSHYWIQEGYLSTSGVGPSLRTD